MSTRRPRSPRSLTKAQLIEETERLRERLTRAEGPGHQASGTEEAEHLRRELAAAHEQQAATSEILQVISSSPTDVQPVFVTIAASASRLCGGAAAIVTRFDGEMIHLVAHHNPRAGIEPITARLYPRRPGRDTTVGRAIFECSIVHIADAEKDSDLAPNLARDVRAGSFLAVPMLRDGRPIGAISVSRLERGEFPASQVELLKTFADQAVIAIENARLFRELQSSNSELRVALEQQTGTSEILGIISRSPTDVQPVFDAIAQSARRLCEGSYCAVARYDGELVHLAAHAYIRAEGVEAMGRFSTMRPSRALVLGRVILDGSVVHIPNVLTDPEYDQSVAEAVRFRSIVGVPLLRDGVPIGAITVSREEASPFTETQIGLLKTFADQAVIAIENVRLFTELQEKNRALTQAHAQVSEALEQQTATSEVLKIISRSAFDLLPVLETLIESAVRLCGADKGLIYRQDGDLYRAAVSYGHSPQWQQVIEQYPIAQDRASATGRAVLERRVVHIHDILADPEYRWAENHLGEQDMHRTILAIPMLREGVVIGVIVIRRTRIEPFTEKQIDLVTTFADQAVIAIENVRLFTELQEKNSALTQAHAQVTETLEQQTATAEILRVIASSPTDAQPVFETIVRSAVILSGAMYGTVARFDGELMHLAAGYNYTAEVARALHEVFPTRPSRFTMSGRAILARDVVEVEDALEDPDYAQGVARAGGFRSMLAAPMLRDGRPIGAIVVNRGQPGRFSPTEIALLRTFADQAVIAIENVRLFTELEARNAELTETVARQTATAEVLRAISGSRTDVQPVFEAIVQSAVRLLRADSGMLSRISGDHLELAAFTSLGESYDSAMRTFWPRPVNSQGTHTLAIRNRAPVNIADAASDPRVPEDGRAVVRLRDIRSVVSVPLLRQSEAIGTIAVNRREAGGFTNDEIALLQTFADQAVIAIENARLLTELQARTRELTRSVDELTALGEVGRALSSTLDLEIVLSTIVARANQLSGAVGGSVYEYDETTEEFALRASLDLPDAYVEQVRDFRPRKGDGALGRVALTRAPVQIVDIADPGAYESRVRDTLLQTGIRALLAVPLVAEDRLVGALIVMRSRAGEFASSEVELLQTFATQSALAIQNARLFREIQEKSRQLEAASQHKSEFLANMSHELRTPLNAIIGYSEMLQEEAQDRQQDAFIPDLERINAAAKHQLGLINDILDLSKVEAGKMELELTHFHLPTAIDNALTLVRERASRRGITLQATIDGRLGDVRADERKIKQVVLNLLSNAVKFTPEGGRIDVRALPVEGGVEVSVGDTGVGIAPEDQDAVFEEFRQVGTSPGKLEGTGLGLTLCRKFVELHGGGIWVKSQAGVGSTFTFTVPIPISK